MNGNRIIVHALIKWNNKYLVTKRSSMETVYPDYWDIPGGLVEIGELPQDALIRETKEEVGLDVIPLKIIHEDSNLDEKKNLIFIRLVYSCKVDNNLKILLEKKEHSEYRFITSLRELKDEKIVPFLYEILGESDK